MTEDGAVLVTGGAGYIGSHTCVALAAAGVQAIVLDNFSNSRRSVLDRVAAITGEAPTLLQGDVRDPDCLAKVFAEHPIGAVIHFAALKAVGESVREPLRYYDNNVAGTVALLRAMQTAGVRTLVFSSSATVYGEPAILPIREDFPLSATNPYGRTKLFIEEILRDLCAADPRWTCVLLRYFNPIGAHESGRLGEDPRGLPNNLMPYVMQVAIGRLPELSVYGDDYPTSDGTGVRDYIHVVDLALGHLAALDRLVPGSGAAALKGCLPINLGTGRGTSVLEMVAAAEKASGRSVHTRVVARRPGDVAACYADPARAAELLGWRAVRDIDRMCADHWRWQSGNPDGYRDAGA